MTWRGIHDWSEESAEWREACLPFKKVFQSSVPKFESKADAIAFIKSHCRRGSNPYDPSLTHVFSMMFTWEQIMANLVPKIIAYRKRFGKRRAEESIDQRACKQQRVQIEVQGDAKFWPPCPPKEVPDRTLAEQYIFSCDERLERRGDTNRYQLFLGFRHNRYLRQEPLEGDEGEFVYEGEGLDVQRVRRSLRARLNLPFHKEITDESVFNTLKYLFFHMRCGIYVMIRGNKLRMFVPFVNSMYKNKWKGHLRIEGDNLEDYRREKSLFYVHEDQNEEAFIRDVDRWWANGNIICNVPSPMHWGDQFLTPIKDMLETLCANRKVPDVEFFVNKRDYPHLKFNERTGQPVEPYGFIFDKDDRAPENDVDLDPEHKYSSYAPILSFYCSPRFADLPILPSEDWEAATGKVYVNSFKHQIDESGDVVLDGGPRDLFTSSNLQKFDCAWEDKINVAFFRGSASGGGVDPDTNQRIKAALLSAEWKSDPVKGGNWYGSKKIANPIFPEESIVYPYLDAALTAWNGRDKKIHSKPMTFLRPTQLRERGISAGKENFTPIYDQSKFKYLVYIEGHCAACRYAFMMRLGSVIIKVDSRCVADQMWYFPLLRPYYDHVPVKEDLSDLAEKIEWCRNNDDRCRYIAKNAKTIWERFCSRDGALDYMQMLLNEVALNWRSTPSWCKSSMQIGVQKPPSPQALNRDTTNRTFHGEGQNAEFDWKRTRDFCCKRDMLCSYCQDEFNKFNAEREKKEQQEKQNQVDGKKERKKYQRRQAERRKRKLQVEQEAKEKEDLANEAKSQSLYDKLTTKT